MRQKIKLSEWARLNSYTYRGAYNLWKQGNIPLSSMNASGSILVEIPPATKTEHNIIYARVSSPINKSNLDMQAERLTAFCSARGWVIHEIIKETASGLNDKRPKLKKILQEKKATRIIIEHKDRLTRFGFEYLKDLFPGEIITVNEVTEDEEDLMQDFVSLVTWYF